MNFSWEGLLRLCEGVSIIAGAVTVMALIGQVAANRVLSGRQALEANNLRLALATQQERAAKAERDLREVQDRVGDVMFTVRPRSLRPFVMSELQNRTLNEFAGTVVEIGAIDEPSCLRLAREIGDLLSRADWRVTWLEPLKETADKRIGDGVRIHIADSVNRQNTPQGRAAIALSTGFTASKVVVRISDPVEGQPLGTMRITVGLQDSTLLQSDRPRTERSR